MNRQQITVLIIIAFLALLSQPSFRVFAEQDKGNQANTKTIAIAGLHDRVTVRRDERGIPYIEAKNQEDLYFAQGYVTASDRLWQMDLLRRTERGELAEVLGAGPNNAALEQDKQHRTLGFAQEVDAELVQAAPASRALLEAYAQGVNAYIGSLDARSLPPEFQILQYKPKPWTPADSLLITKVFAEGLSSTWRLDLMRAALAGLPAEKRAGLMPETSPLDVLVVGKDSKETNRKASSAHPAGSSNNFSRETLLALARDGELANQALARVGLYAEGLAASNNWVVSGQHTATGKPLLANDPHLPGTAPSIWYMVHLSAPGLHVAGVSAPSGPGVIIGHNDRIAWGMTNVGPDVQDLYEEKFDPANPQRYLTPEGWRNVDVRHEEIKVRKGFTDSATDTVTLDVSITRHGPIIFQNGGKRYALRWTALDPKLNGTDSVYMINRARDWKDFNDALRTFTAPTQNITADDFRRIQGDVYSIGNVLFAREIAKALRPRLTPADTKLGELLDNLDKWDGLVNADSHIAPLLWQIRIAFRSRVLAAALGDDLVKTYQWGNFDVTIDRLITEQPKDWLPKEFSSYADLLLACYQDARAVLTKNIGTDESKWTWGEMVKVRFTHPLAGAPLIGLQFTIPPFPQNGTGGLAATPNVGGSVSMRLIADPSDWDKTQHGIALGESGIPSSPHWNDQLADWRAVTPRVFPFSEAAVAKATQETMVLEPKK